MNKAEIADVLEQLANGINPETGKSDSATEILESPTSVSALFGAVNILRNNTELKSDNSEKRIDFYLTNGKYGFLSNFSRYEFILDNKTWPTSEHYFQAKKFEGEPDEEEIRLAETPNAAARMGRQRSRPLRNDWGPAKDAIMYKALLAKFTQHESIKAKLIDTGTAEIVEHTTKDSYWGDGGDGSGRNMLGKLLMKLRADLKNS